METGLEKIETTYNKARVLSPSQIMYFNPA